MIVVRNPAEGADLATPKTWGEPVVVSADDGTGVTPGKGSPLTLLMER